ncbi:MAG: iron ABC transporter permease [Marinobacterium sp.]|nr:iron ABC transporter permease [Marinobacterium sp.]
MKTILRLFASWRALLLLAAVLLLTVMLVALGSGPSQTGFAETLQGVINRLVGERMNGLIREIAPWQQTIIDQVRLPRIITAAFVGAALAVSGAVLQGIFRNPLASPSILGVSSGASLGAVLAIFFGFAANLTWALPLFAFVGAGLTLVLVYRVATWRGHTPVGTLLLAGVAVGAFNVSMSSLILALALENWEVGKSIVYWTMGGLDGRNWHHVLLIAPVFMLGYVLVLTRQREMDIMLTGEVHASAVGVDVAKVRLQLLIVTALLTGCAVAVAGGIGFIGLVIPHVARLLIGPQHRRLLPFCALLGATLLVLADLLARGNTNYTTIPLGVITATLGAPFFLFLLLRQRKLMQV